MTDRELIWLSSRLHKSAMVDVQRQAQEVHEHWFNIPLSPDAITAAQRVAVEIEVIRHGGLRLLNREPA